MGTKKNKSEEEEGGMLGGMLKQILSITSDVEEVLDREVKPVGNSGRINIPRKHIGKKAKVYILNNKKKNREEKKS